MACVAYLAIINNKDQPIYLKNFIGKTEFDLQFQLNSLATLDIFELYSMVIIKIKNNSNF